MLKRGDFRSRVSETTHADIEFMRRCPEYTQYFSELHSVKEKPNYQSVACGAALKQHQAIFDKGKKTKKGDYV
jgi:hypothetical protein